MRDVKELTRKLTKNRDGEEKIINKNKVSWDTCYTVFLLLFPLIWNEIEDEEKKKHQRDEEKSLISFDINIMLYFNLTFSSVCNIFISLHTSELLHNIYFYDFDRKTDSRYGRRILIIEHSVSLVQTNNHKIERMSKSLGHCSLFYSSWKFISLMIRTAKLCMMMTVA